MKENKLKTILNKVWYNTNFQYFIIFNSFYLHTNDLYSTYQLIKINVHQNSYTNSCFWK